MHAGAGQSRDQRTMWRQMMATEKPNVLLILADDIGWFDISAYHRGVMGCRTPNIAGRRGADHHGGGGCPGYQGAAAERPPGRRQALPGPPRRLQPTPVSDRRGRRVPAARVLLLRRARSVRPSVQQLEGALPGEG